VSKNENPGETDSPRDNMMATFLKTEEIFKMRETPLACTITADDQ
jgi:hypothetical protein